MTPKSRRVVWVALVLLLCGAAWFVFRQREAKPAAARELPNAVPAAEVAGVGCIGRVQPEGGLIAVAAAPVLGRTPVVANLLVKEGEWVATGQRIAVLESLPDLESAVRQADARVAVAQSRIAQLQAGPREGDVLALQAEVARLQTDASASRRNLEREEALQRKDFVPRVQADAARLKTQDAEQLLESARHRLESLTEVRGSDLKLARAELAEAEAGRDRARIDQQAGVIRSPIRGRVMQIVARPGEAVGSAGVVVLADTSRMDVVAEIYETDIVRVRIGQRAVIRSPSLAEPVDGVVDWISPQIENRSVPVEPSAPADQRVYQARIKVDRPELLAQRINAKVDVLIKP